MSRVKAGAVYLDVEESGEGPPLLLIMGLGMDKRGWLLQIPYLAQTHRVVAFDNRGVGKSDVPPGPYTIAQMADDAAALVCALGLKKVQVAGISMGGMIAQELALRHPYLVDKLALIATYSYVSEEVKRVSQNLTEKILGPGKSLFQADLSQLTMEKIITGMMEAVFTPAFLSQNRPIIESFYQEYLKEEPSLEGFFYQLVATQTHNTYDRLHSISHPTLILHGREDELIPPSASEEMAKRIPNSELTFMEGTGHALNFEKPQEFNEILAAFFS